MAEGPKCNHQYSTIEGKDRIEFNYCPWCGESLWIKVEDEEDENDDCQKRGCAD